MSTRLRQCLYGVTFSFAMFAFLGCNGDKSSSSSTTGSKTSSSETTDENAGPRETLEAYPDVPKIKLMEEVAGIPIPRVETEGETLEIGGPITADVGNPDAKSTSLPVDGGRVVMRVESEPKTMNPITESSAVQTIMSNPYLLEGLAYQDPESFEYEAMIAKNWIVEDSIKLDPLYEGQERFVSLEGEEPATDFEFEYPKSKGEEKPPSFTLITYGPERKPVGETWVGLFPVGDIVGAPKNGYHRWSDEAGKLAISGIVPGKYQVLTGYEIIGSAEEAEDSSLKVAALSPKSELKDLMGDKEYLELTAEDYIDLQRGTVYTYLLDDRVVWSDGTPYTAQDLVFAYNVINNIFVDGDSIRSYYESVIRCDALDDLTIQMQYREQYFKAFEFTSGLPAYGPPLHLFERFLKEDGLELTMEQLTEEEEKSQKKVSVHGAKFAEFFNTDPRYNRAPLGTGPYIVDEWIDNDRLVLKRNPNYWNDEYRGYLDEIVFKFIPDDNTAFLALKAGDIDFFYRMTSEQAFETLDPKPDWFKQKYIMSHWYIPSFSYIGWNLRNPMFAERETRLALAMLLDVEDFLEKKLYGQGVLVSGSAYYFSPAYDRSVKPIAFDPDTARDLLEEAGWADTDGDGILDRDGQKFEFTLSISSGRVSTEIMAGLLQENCKAVGISMQVDKLEWASFLEKVLNREFDAVTLGWMSPLESDPYQIWHSSQAEQERSSNHVGFENRQADELIEQVRVTLDKDKRSAIFHSLHRILDKEQPYRFLYTGKAHGAYNKRFRGVKWYRIRPGFDLTEWWVPKELQQN
ncbi:MAG: ABC transporter substrate-binding protein [Planctomycetaceae bacterium]|nr:ABC transporter substrate-binding protein [Planctomycetaceae bacterium]